MPNPSLRIAIADDERDIRDFLKKVLPLLGHSVVVAAADGDELVAACAAEPPDLIITDLKMPKRDGLSALEEIWRTSPVPAIVISAHPEQLTRGPWAGSPWVSLLIKPVRMSELEPAIIRALEKSRGAGSPIAPESPLPNDSV